MGRFDDAVSGTTNKPDDDSSSTETSRTVDGDVGARGQAPAAPDSGAQASAAQDLTSRDLPSQDLPSQDLDAPHDEVAAAVARSSATDHPTADDDLLAAVAAMPAISDIDHTFDQLVTSVDLFDIPAFDLGDTT